MRDGPLLTKGGYPLEWERYEPDLLAMMKADLRRRAERSHMPRAVLARDVERRWKRKGDTPCVGRS